jgi:molybdopterin converting factor small subunit
MRIVKVNVKLLGTYKNLLPPDADNYNFEVEITSGTTLSTLMSSYNVPLTDDTVFLVNGVSPKTLEHILEDGDTIAAFSAVAGG